MVTATFKAIPNYEYHQNGVYARFNSEGVLVTNDAKLIGILSKHEPFIKRLDAVAKAVDEVADAPSEFEPEHVGGGYYLLSNGEKIKGKDAAIKAEAKLEK
ncbi:hypothetical protein PZE06_22320 [Robertmurraya sp. DFI.2.37]|uniref:hypothetical protein n=1 Tax=Robertmurraya sp. DFI.2.37 TaxID=3031819 RepID=UPI0023DBCFAD|nr:hypothetical protein [Robertmurraya sp. DFI.2.37]MDF1510873.1 hypothetical protein [Robertmurraya sp. DFI.2.37]